MTLHDALQVLSENPTATIDLAEVALLIAKDEYPALDVRERLGHLDRLADAVRPKLAGNLEARVAVLSQFLFEDEGFEGNSSDYYDPRNNYFNEVLERKLGIPITLAVVAIAVGNRAGLEVHGVGLPGHFIAKAVDGADEVLFDPFHGGQILTPAGCGALIEAVTGHSFELPPEVFEPSPLALIVVRMLNNLKAIHLEQDDFPRAVRVMERLRTVTPEDILLRRDLGVALVRADRPGAAIGHLEAYLATTDAGEESQLVRQVLQQAKVEASRWN